MSSVLVAAFKMTFGLFLDKARSSLCENLKDRDLNSQQVRSLIISNMKSIESKIDGLALRDLASSAHRIKEGLFMLNDLLHSPQRVCESTPDIFGDAFDYIVRFKSWLKRSDKKADVTLLTRDYFDLNKNWTSDLIDTMSNLRFSLPNEVKFAMESFNEAYNRATDVFSDESLDLKHRIMAAKLRIQSRLLISLEHPDLAKVCKLYLQDLHDLPQVVEIFRYDVEGGMLSNFNKAERHELVQSVTLINSVVYRFLNSFTKEVVNVYDWPVIENEARMYNPLIPDATLLAELQLAEIEMQNMMSLKPLKVMDIDPKLMAINSRGDLVFFRHRTNPDICEMVKVSGNDVEVFYTFPEFTLVSFLAINVDDSVHVFADNVQSNVPPGYLMYDVFVFGPRGGVTGIYKRFLLLDGSILLAPTPRKFGPTTRRFVSDKLPGDREWDVAFCIPDKVMIKEGNIPGEVQSWREEKEIQGGVGNRSKESVQGEVEIRSEEEIQGGANSQVTPKELKKLETILVEIKMGSATLATITDGCKVVTVEQFGYNVRVFEKDGRFLREFELHEREREACVGITFNYLMKELVVVSRVEDCYFLSSYTLETGQRRLNVRLSHIGGDCQNIHLTSHCSGSMAVMTMEHVLFLQ